MGIIFNHLFYTKSERERMEKEHYNGYSRGISKQAMKSRERQLSRKDKRQAERAESGGALLRWGNKKLL